LVSFQSSTSPHGTMVSPGLSHCSVRKRIGVALWDPWWPILEKSTSRISFIASGLLRTCSHAPYWASPGNSSRSPPPSSTKNRLVLLTDCSRNEGAANSPTSLDSVVNLRLDLAFCRWSGTCVLSVTTYVRLNSAQCSVECSGY